MFRRELLRRVIFALALLPLLLAPLAASAQSAALVCPTPEAALPGAKVTLQCTAGPGLGAATVLLFYRVSGSEEFTPVPTLRTPSGTFTAVLHPGDLSGSVVHYYFEARDAADRMVATAGDEESPQLLLIRAAPLPVAAAPRRDEAPLGELRRGADDAPAARVVQRRRASRVWFVGAGGGLGYGWHPARRLDYRRDLRVADGVGVAGLPQLTPEVGLQLTDRWALSLQGRWQFGAIDGAGDVREGAPHRNAWALLARARRFLGAGALHPFLSAAVGVGQGFRVNVPPVPDFDLQRSDTVRGGPFVLGPGAGVMYHFTPRVAASLELRGLAGLPGLALVADAVTAIEVAF